MNKIILTLCITMTISGVFSQSTPPPSGKNSYTDQWEEVHEFEKRSLPQSAARKVDTILKQAMEDKNTPQIIKAVIHHGKYDLTLDAENDTVIFHRLHQLLDQQTHPVARSVLHSLLGELYLQYYQKDQWNIDQRTELGDVVPSDMKEWTSGIFQQKVIAHILQSVQEQEALEKARVETYADVVLMGKDSRTYFPTLYDFLSRRAVEILAQLTDRAVRDEQVLNVYGDHLSSLTKRGMAESSLLVELDRIEYVSTQHEDQRKESRAALEQLLEQWEGKAMSVEIIDKLANLYDQENDEQKKEFYELLQKYIASYPDYDRVGVLENRLNQLTQSEFHVSGNKAFHSGDSLQLNVTFKNLPSLSAKLYRVMDAKEIEKANRGMRDQLNLEFVDDVSFTLPKTAPYLQQDTTVHLDPLEKGTYLLRFAPLSRTNPMLEHYFAVTDIAVFTRTLPDDRYDFFAVDRKTGEPLANASILVYKLPGNWRNSQLTKVASLPVDASGMVVYHKDIPNNDVYYQVVTPTDRGSFLNRLPTAYWSFNNEEEVDKEEVVLFTDRSIYRPGQIVYFKGIRTRVQKNGSMVVAGKATEVTLRDANGQEISVQRLQSNEYGSVSGEFVLPTGLLPGSFSLVAEGGSTHFQVEEYKRPTFEITFDTVRQTYKFDQEVDLSGKAVSYSGILLQDARVAYRITRRPVRWWSWSPTQDHVDEGETRTNSEGVFELSFTPQKPEENRLFPSIYSYTVEATVTDITGETQSGVYTLVVGDVSMIISLEMSDRMEKSSEEKVVISARNLNGSPITATGTYQLFSLLENDSIHQEVARGDFITGEQPELKNTLIALPSGKYRVKLTSNDDQGNEVTTEEDILLFSYEDKHPPIKTNAWYLEKNTRFGEGVPAEIILGSSEPIHVLYELWQGHTLLEREWLAINGENRLFSLPYTSAYEEGVTLRLTYVKEGKFYAHRSDLRPAKKEKKLTVRLDVFRDRIRPGTAEEWRVSVIDAAGDPASAEVLASMYDFSLDHIYPTRRWYLPNYALDRYRSNTMLQSDQSFTTASTFGYASVDYETIPQWEFDRFNWFDFSLFYYGGMMFRTADNQLLHESVVVGYAQPKVAAAPPAEEQEAAAESTATESATTEEAPQVRRNFNETAFFYPGLRTNEKGQTVIAFTVPESNTRWHFRVLAHDKTLNHGHAEAFTVSRKELMVTPNMPRFLRHGDYTSIAAKVSNLSDSVINGTVTIEFFDPATEETLENLSPLPEQPFSLVPNASSDVAWSFDVPEGIDVVGVRIIARGDQFSDGEQHALAVLPNRMMVTESMRMDVRAGETKTFTMEGLTGSSSTTLENYRLTLEFTANPAWYAVQALPVLSEPTSDNAISWFASYYAHAMGTHVAKTYPKVAAMVDLWQKQGGDAQTLLSNLEKNQDLKQVLLEETPWVLAARDESEQKQKLALLFDLNRSTYRTRDALDKLTELQSNQGGWSWFKGFRPSVVITHYILYGFQQLAGLHAIEQPHELAPMLEEAIHFIDAEAIRRFEALKKNDKEWRKMQRLPITDLEYAFIRTSYPHVALDKEVKEMIDFYLSVAQTHWSRHGLYERSLIALLMEQEGEGQTTRAILASFREHATRDAEMGMYWANNRANVFMSQSALSVHTFIMDAFRAGGADAREMDEMKQWLLKQKQSQAWETTHATMDAIYILLSMGSDWFSGPAKTQLQIGRHTVDPASGDPGTGYIKTTWSGSDITPDMGTVRVTHDGTGPAWGALYRQYFEDLDKIEKSDGSLDIEKELYVEEMKPGGPQLMRITEERPLKVGDKVTVRLVLRTDRDLEFVHLKDTRAAAFEPVDQISGTGWQNGIIYYRTSKDASTNFYIDVLPRGTYVFEYSVRVNRVGRYSNGITTLQCLYAPEFTSHTAGIRVIITE